jgi:predicted neutral ceramidase superfamily lipid hydrolase
LTPSAGRGALFGLPDGRERYTTKVETSEVPASQLDDARDREELRRRYYGLLQELRVMLPGVQLLAAFLLTVPFAQRFAGLDDLDRALYLGALSTAIVSVLAFVTPIVLHRFGRRTARGVRLIAGTAAARIGIVALVVSIALSMAVVCRFVFDDVTAVVVVAVLAVGTVGLWGLLPRWARRVHARGTGSSSPVPPG